MPVGTAGSVKAVHATELAEDIQAQIILGNTYHLYLRPGLEVLKETGGLHRFISWDRPILTDSGGFQVFSLTENRKLTEEGALFQSHMAFDECTPGDADYAYAKRSLDLTEKWLDRCIARFEETECPHGYSQALFPIVQGCVYPDLRRRAAEQVASKEAPGNAIGGLAVGEPTETMYEMIELVNDILPKDKPRYLMGVGKPENLLEAIERGVDMFDCVLPTRNGRNGQLFTKQGVMNIRNERWKNDFSPLEEDGPSFVDRLYSKAYLRHLITTNEILGLQIASIHNLAFYAWLMQEARRHIIAGDFPKWKADMLEKVTRRL
jgi:queuine tRNA-ribosyltransferase